MDRKMSARKIEPLRTLDDEELSTVSGGRRRYRRAYHEALAGPSGASSGNSLAPTNVVNFFQVLNITGNTAPVAVVNLLAIG